MRYFLKLALLVFLVLLISRVSLVAQNAQCLLHIETAWKFRVESKLDSAFAHYSIATRIAEGSADTVLFFKGLNGLADVFLCGMQFAQAESVLSIIASRGPEEIGPDHLEMAVMYTSLGYIRAAQDRYAEAISYVQRSLDIRRRQLGDEDLDVASSYYELGGVYVRMGEYQKAMDVLQKAMSIQRKALGAKHIIVADTALELGVVLYGRSEYTESVKMLNEALTIMQDLRLPNTLEVAQCYHYLALNSKETGRYHEAVEFGEKSLEVMRKSIGNNNSTVSACLTQLGDDLVLMGDYGAARQYYDEALAINKTLFEHSPASTFEIVWKLARLQAAIGDLDEAIRLGLEAVESETRTLGPTHSRMATIFSNVGAIFEEKGDWKKALEYYRKALVIRQADHVSAYNMDIAGILKGIAGAFSKGGELDSASAALHLSMAIQDSCKIPNRVLRSSAYKILGDIYRKQKDVNRALTMYQSALASLCPGFIDSSWSANPPAPGGAYDRDFVRLLAAKAMVLEEVYGRGPSDFTPLKVALAAYTRAAESLDELRKSFTSEGSKLYLQAEVLPLYASGEALCKRLFDATADRNYLNAAFLFAERSKSAVLLEGMQAAKALHFSGVPDSLSREEESLAKQTTALSAQVSLSEEHHDSVGASEPRRRLFVVSRRYRQLQDEIGKNYPAYAELRYGSRYATVSEVQHVMPFDGCLLEYTLSDTTLYILAVGRDTVILHSAPLPQDFIELARGYVTSIKMMDKSRFVSASRRLYDLLVGPVSSFVEKKRHLTVVPDAVLHYIPFESLLRPALLRASPGSSSFAGLPYLITSHDISYAFSGSLLVSSLLREASDAKPAPSFAGFAPVFADSSSTTISPAPLIAALADQGRERAVTYEDKKFSALKYSEDEVRAIVGRFHEKQIPGTGYFHRDATERNFRDNAGKCAYLHIATHGYLNEKNPELSALLFSPSGDSVSENDGVLYAGETYNLHLNAELVVLSSCESGIGKLAKGEGLMAMARGFFYAGARNLLFSLWKMGDKNTDDLMQLFYRNILDGESFSSGLRNAKLQLIKNEATAFPLTWAGFVLLGQ